MTFEQRFAGGEEPGQQVSKERVFQKKSKLWGECPDEKRASPHGEAEQSWEWDKQDEAG